MAEWLRIDDAGITVQIAIPEGLQTAAWLIGLTCGLALVLKLIEVWNRRQPSPRRLWRGLTGSVQRNYVTPLILFGIIALGWSVAAYLWQIPLLIGAMLARLKLQMAGTDTSGIRDIAYTFAALAGMLAILATIPFQLVRVWINERTARTQEANLTTSLINTAVEGLGAEKTVSRIGRPVTFSMGGAPDRTEIEWRGQELPDPPEAGWHRRSGDWQTFDATQPNLEVRIGAIYTLERIARTDPAEHIRVMDILCAYVRENAPARDAMPHEPGEWPEYPEGMTQDHAVRRSAELRERAERLRAWVASLPPPRTDVQAVLEVIGRRDPERIGREEAAETRSGAEGYRLNLRQSNLRRYDLSHLDFRRADLVEARMEGADLWQARMEGADLREARMEGAYLSGARMEGADLREARMEGADLWQARMEGAYLRGARMEGANLWQARMEGADLREARMEGADLWQARMEGAYLRGARMEGANLWQARMEGADLRGARMEGANLSGARMEGADLWQARMEGADLRGADLRNSKWAGASIRASPAHFADLRGAQDVTQAQLDQFIGNAGTLLPEGNAPDTGEPYHVWSCWETPPEGFDDLVRYLYLSNPFVSESELRAEFLCRQDNPARKLENGLPVSAPYPPGHPLAEGEN
ncbi:pentapeptide repeat-containing protein [Amaricoccus solimangrovi]|uniref:Pentapeptide repeat-containing protein n=1 Tax=Amaricoccus solimangrovi TaxID=2589815 RepID=A0A501WSZ8_9RHOB|nr:pentapeptide repeat-containing protein [Amaricoccus solimangrovi]TPE51495.1 pentapeptide repeat-containing protein [Amaricoccus solimangrovi]